MATFAQLQTRVGQIIIDLPATVTAQLPSLVNEALKELQDLHNFKVMEKVSSVYTTTAESSTLATKPTDFKEFRGKPILINALGDIQRMEVVSGREEAWSYYGTDAGGEASVDVLKGRPRVLWISEPSDELGTASFQIAPLPDALSLYTNGNYRILVPYWRYLTTLSGSSDTNWFTINGEEWIVFKAASMGFFDDHNDEKGTLWANLAAGKWQQILKADKRLRASQRDTLIPQPEAMRGPLSRGGRWGGWRGWRGV